MSAPDRFPARVAPSEVPRPLRTEQFILELPGPERDERDHSACIRTKLLARMPGCAL